MGLHRLPLHPLNHKLLQHPVGMILPPFLASSRSSTGHPQPFKSFGLLTKGRRHSTMCWVWRRLDAALLRVGAQICCRMGRHCTNVTHTTECVCVQNWTSTPGVEQSIHQYQYQPLTPDCDAAGEAHRSCQTSKWYFLLTLIGTYSTHMWRFKNEEGTTLLEYAGELLWKYWDVWIRCA